MRELTQFQHKIRELALAGNIPSHEAESLIRCSNYVFHEVLGNNAIDAVVIGIQNLYNNKAYNFSAQKAIPVIKSFNKIFEA